MKSRQGDFRVLAEWDWVVTSTYEVLHHLRDADFDALNRDWGGEGVTSCGVRSEFIAIPGLFTRGGARRCKRCCDRLGWPQGVGSPKNDAALRPLVAARLGGDAATVGGRR